MTSSRLGRTPQEYPDRAWIGLAWISPWIAGVVLFVAAPLAMSLWYSLTDYPILERPVFIGLENYARLARDPMFWTALGNTALYVAIVVPAGTLVALGLACLLQTSAPGWTLARLAFFLPTLVPAGAVAMVWLWLLNTENGLLNTLLGPVLSVAGLSPPAWLQTPSWAFASMIIIALWQVGQMVVIFQAALRDVPRSLYEAAELDGVSGGRMRGLWGLRRFWHVTLPMISPAVFFGIVTGIIGASQVFVYPFIMTAGGPGTATRFYAMELYDRAFLFGPQMGYACAMAWVQLVVLSAVTWGVFRVTRGRIFQRA